MFIVSLTYVGPLEEVDAHLDAHVAFLKKEYADGHFVASGRKVPRTGGIILSNVPTRDALEVILYRDPFHINNLAKYEIIEFVPSMTAEGFEALQES